MSSNEQNPGDKFYNTTVEVLPSYQRDKKEGILEAENHQDNKFNRTQDGYIQVGKKSLRYVMTISVLVCTAACNSVMAEWLRASNSSSGAFSPECGFESRS